MSIILPTSFRTDADSPSLGIYFPGLRFSSLVGSISPMALRLATKVRNNRARTSTFQSIMQLDLFSMPSKEGSDNVRLNISVDLTVERRDIKGETEPSPVLFASLFSGTGLNDSKGVSKSLEDRESRCSCPPLSEEGSTQKLCNVAALPLKLELSRGVTQSATPSARSQAAVALLQCMRFRFPLLSRRMAMSTTSPTK